MTGEDKGVREIGVDYMLQCMKCQGVNSVWPLRRLNLRNLLTFGELVSPGDLAVSPPLRRLMA